MKVHLCLLFILPFLAYTKVTLHENIDSTQQSDIIQDSNVTDSAVDNVLGYFDVNGLSDMIVYTVNITISPWETPNFCGILFTTQQFNSLFPTMKSIPTPYNVSVHILAPLDPFKIMNFSGFKINVNFKAQITILIPDLLGDKPWTTCNASGYLNLQVVDLFKGIRFYIRDYMVNEVIVPDSEREKIDRSQGLIVANSLGQLGIDYANHLLSQKPLIMRKAEKGEHIEPTVIKKGMMTISVGPTESQESV